MRRPRSPYLKLARLIEDEGFEHREFAKLVGMGESTLSTRLNPKPSKRTMSGAITKSPPFAGSCTFHRNRSESISSRKSRKEHKHEGKTLHRQ